MPETVHPPRGSGVPSHPSGSPAAGRPAPPRLRPDQQLAPGGGAEHAVGAQPVAPLVVLERVDDGRVHDTVGSGELVVEPGEDALEAQHVGGVGADADLARDGAPATRQRCCRRGRARRPRRRPVPGRVPPAGEAPSPVGSESGPGSSAARSRGAPSSWRPRSTTARRSSVVVGSLGGVCADTDPADTSPAAASTTATTRRRDLPQCPNMGARLVHPCDLQAHAEVEGQVPAVTASRRSIVSEPSSMRTKTPSGRASAVTSSWRPSQSVNVAVPGSCTTWHVGGRSAG